MKRQRPKYEKPLRPYDKTRIDKEKRIKSEYGLKRKREIWRAENILRNIRRQARDLVASQDEEREQELRNKLMKLGLVREDDPIEAFLSLELTDLLDRRLQTVVYKKGLANTVKQARQYIVHGHIAVDGQKVNYPSYLVAESEENNVDFYERSSLQGSHIEKAEEEIKEEKEKIEGKPDDEETEESNDQEESTEEETKEESETKEEVSEEEASEEESDETEEAEDVSEEESEDIDEQEDSEDKEEKGEE